MRVISQPPISSMDGTYPVKNRKHHVELLLLLLLGHVARRVAQLGEEAPQVHEAERVVLGAALVLPGPPHDPFHHVHLERLCQGKGSPADDREIPQFLNPPFQLKSKT